MEPNPGPRRRDRLTTEQRYRVIHLALESHLSARAIGRRMNIDHRTAANILKKYHETGGIEDRPRRAKKRKITEKEAKKIIKKAKSGMASTEIAREFRQEHNESIHEQTIRNVLHEHHFYYLKVQPIEALTEEQQQNRLTYATELINYNFKTVLFGDEKTFWLGSGTSSAWQVIGQRKTHEVRRHPPKLHVWAAVGYYFKSKLYFFTENMKAKLYQKILRSRLVERKIIYADDCPERYKGNWVYLQDNDPKHKTPASLQTIEELVGPRLLTMPAYSPDMNVMEDAWSYLNRRIQARKVTTLQGLKRQLTLEWDAMPWPEIRVSVESMQARLQECINLRGARTHY